MTAPAAILEPESEVRPKALSGPRARLQVAGKLELAEQIAAAHDVTVEMMWSKRRLFEAVTAARHHFWAELRQLEFNGVKLWSYPRIAGLCDRDHTTVIEGVKAWRKRMEAR